MNKFSILLLLLGTACAPKKLYKGSELQQKIIASMPLKQMAFMQSCIGEFYDDRYYNLTFTDCLERAELLGVPKYYLRK